MKPYSVYTFKQREMSKFFWLLGIILVTMSCGKDIDVFIPRANQVVVGDINRLRARLAEDIKGEITYSIQVPCSGNHAFKVDKDLVLVIPKDFVNLAEYPCTDGHFDVEVTVCDSKGEILMAGIPTISEGKLLESRMEFKIRITDGTTPVRLAHGKTIRALINDPDPRERMELFYGNNDNTEWLQADADLSDWSNVENSEWWLQGPDSNIITGFGYECFSDSTDWINVDVFFEIPEDQRTDVCVELPKEFTNTNTQVFMVFDDYKSVVVLEGNADLELFCEHYGSTPKGFNVTFIVISEMGEDSYLFDSYSTSITENHVQVLKPVHTPYEEIKNFLDTL